MAKKEVKYEVVTITPIMAKQWLENSAFDNRKLDSTRIIKIASDIKKGKWIFDGTPIRFNGKDNILDGQHRLTAIVKADKEVSSLVIRGLETQSKNTIDTGKSRSVADVLHFNGHINTTTLAATGRLAVAYRDYKGDLAAWSKSSSRAAISNQEIVDEIANNSKLVNSIQSVISLRYVKRLIGGGTAGFIYYMFTKVSSQHLADSFFQSLERGHDLTLGSPILELRNTLALRDSKMGFSGQRRSTYNIALFIKAWNAWRGNEEAKQLRYSFEEEFPKPIK